MTTSPELVADLILNAMPEAPRSADDAEYVPRFADLMRLVERAGMLPIAYADYFEPRQGMGGRLYPVPSPACTAQPSPLILSTANPRAGLTETMAAVTAPRYDGHR